MAAPATTRRALFAAAPALALASGPASAAKTAIRPEFAAIVSDYDAADFEYGEAWDVVPSERGDRQRRADLWLDKAQARLYEARPVTLAEFREKLIRLVSVGGQDKEGGTLKADVEHMLRVMV